MSLEKALIWTILGAFLFGCSPDPEKLTYAYARSPRFFRADTTKTDHPLCAQSPSIPECSATKKYRLTWNRPDDTVNLLGYRVYLDTIPPDAPAGQKWDYVKDRPELASVFVQRHGFVDSLVFVFSGSGERVLDTLGKEGDRVFVIDSLGRSEDVKGNLTFALVPVYGSGIPGLPQLTFFVTTDKEPPLGFHPSYHPMARTLSIAWERPTDPTSFFNPSLDTGLIREYVLEVAMAGRRTLDRKRIFGPTLLSYKVGDEELASTADTAKSLDSVSIRFSLPDGNRASKRTSPTLEDSLYVLIGNLVPRDTLEISLYAIDSSGNTNFLAMERVNILTTDTTRPSKPLLSIDEASVTGNGFTVTWSASKDSVPDAEGVLRESATPNDFIRNYRLTRLLQRPPGEKISALDRVDTLVEISGGNRRDTAFTQTVRFLPPGTTFRLVLTATDSSGFQSESDTALVRTDSVRFAGADSVLVCPPGFIPVPGSKLKLGDDRMSPPVEDEKARTVNIGPYCIEPYEHRDSTSNRFVSNLTYERAAEICRGMDTAYSTQLCSEAQWERACEGPDTSAPLLHGIQSEGDDPSILQSKCNQGTNDSAMAMSFSLRNAVCLTTEGVYDMAGNLSEWVRDEYAADAYQKIPGDDVGYGYFHGSPDDSSAVHTVRGGNYLKTNYAQQSQTQSLARCSNRDMAQQVRPKFREDCKDSTGPKIVLIYGPGVEGHRCIPVPPKDSGYTVDQITDLVSNSRDSTKIQVFLAGVPTPKIIDIPPQDSAVRDRRPLSIRLTTRSLAEVAFEKSDGSAAYLDTLDALEMKDTSQAGLEKIFRREAPNRDWSVAKGEDGRYRIKFIYAYSYLGSKPAKPGYSSRFIGFRCCSQAKAAPLPVPVPVPVPVPTDTVATNP